VNTKDYLLGEDPVAKAIIEEYYKLRTQVDKLAKQIESTKSVLDIKSIKDWKASDFYNYFVIKYEEKYQKNYHIQGSMGTAINKIAKFLHDYNILSEDFKYFIDRCFSRYFSDVVIPVLGHIVSISLYDKMMNTKTVKNMEANDKAIEQERNKFEQEISILGDFREK
jgi:hypothetical protein